MSVTAVLPALTKVLPLAPLAQDDPCGVACQWVLERTNNEFIARLVGIFLPDVLRVLAILLVAWLVNRLVRRFIRRLVDRMVEEESVPFTGLRRAGPLAGSQPINPQRAVMRTETIGAVLRSFSTLVIWTVVALVAIGTIETVDIDLGPLLASAGIVGVALGFGAQSLVKDFLSGTFMLLEDQYGIGDIVDLGPATGTVERITLRKTQLRDVEGTVWHIPNGEIRRVGNFSQLWSRTLLDVEVSYDTDLRHAMAVMDRVATELAADPEWSHKILERPSVWGVDRFSEYSITIRMVIKTEPAQQWAVNRELRLRLKEAFDAEGIVIPVPERTVRFSNGDGQFGRVRRDERQPDDATAIEDDVT